MVIGIEGDSSRGRVASRPMKTNDLRNNASHAVRYTSPNVDMLFRDLTATARTIDPALSPEMFSTRFSFPSEKKARPRIQVRGTIFEILRSAIRLKQKQTKDEANGRSEFGFNLVRSSADKANLRAEIQRFCSLMSPGGFEQRLESWPLAFQIHTKFDGTNVSRSPKNERADNWITFAQMSRRRRRD